VRYVPYHKLGKTPNVIVDGRSNAATVLPLSHWPDSGTPEKYRADLSAQIVFRYLDDPEGPICEVVSNNHFDEDGLVGLFCILYPKLGQQYRDVLIDVASAGDFGVFKERDAARISFVISAWSTPELSPLNQGVFARPYPEVTAILYEELLVRLPNVIDKIDNLKRYWEEEDAFLGMTEEAINQKEVTIEEFKDLDLAIVTVTKENFPDGPREHCPSWVSSVVHPMALHNLTSCMKVLVIKGQRYELYYRYETWVDFVSRPLIKRIDLSHLAKKFSTLEKGRARWQFTGNDEIISRLKLVGAEHSLIEPNLFIDEVKASLKPPP
jgi:hypothetical protein